MCGLASAASGGSERCPAGMGRRWRLWARLARSFTCLARTTPCAVCSACCCQQRTRIPLAPPEMCGRTPGATPTSLPAIAFASRRRGCLEPAAGDAPLRALLASPRHAVLVADALRDASQRFLHRSAVPRRRGRLWTCAPRDPPGHFERARPPFKNPLRPAARSDAQRSRAEF